MMFNLQDKKLEHQRLLPEASEERSHFLEFISCVDSSPMSLWQPGVLLQSGPAGSSPGH